MYLYFFITDRLQISYRKLTETYKWVAREQKGGMDLATSKRFRKIHFRRGQKRKDSNKLMNIIELQKKWFTFEEDLRQPIKNQLWNTIEIY
jgi:hypothetical protein